MNIDNPIQQAIEAKKAHNKMNNPVKELMRDFDDSARGEGRQILETSATTPWLKLANQICSPQRKLGDFNQFLSNKIKIEEKLEKYPFNDLQLREQIKEKRLEEKKLKKKISRKYKSQKNVRAKLGGQQMLVNDMSQNSNIRQNRRQTIIAQGPPVQDQNHLAVPHNDITNKGHACKLENIQEHHSNLSQINDSVYQYDKQSFIERIKKNETTIKLFNKTNVFSPKILKTIKDEHQNRLTYVKLINSQPSQTPKMFHTFNPITVSTQNTSQFPSLTPKSNFDQQVRQNKVFRFPNLEPEIKSSYIKYSVPFSFNDMSQKINPKILKLETTKIPLKQDESLVQKSIFPQKQKSSISRNQLSQQCNTFKNNSINQGRQRFSIDNSSYGLNQNYEITKSRNKLPQNSRTEVLQSYFTNEMTFEDGGDYQFTSQDDNKSQQISEQFDNTSQVQIINTDMKKNVLLDLIAQRRQKIKQATSVKNLNVLSQPKSLVKDSNFSLSRGSVFSGLNLERFEQENNLKSRKGSQASIKTKPQTASLPVDLYEILIPKDNDWDIMNELGNLNYLHFINLNKNEQPHHLRYFNFVKRCEDSEFLIKEIEDICQMYHVDLRTPANIEQFLQQANLYTIQRGKAAHLLFNDIENDLVDKGRFLKQQQQGLDTMIQHFKTILAKINILNQALKLFNGNLSGPANSGQLQSLSDIDREQTQSMSVGLSGIRNDMRAPLLSERSRIVYIGGVLPKSEQMSFKKLIFRATRGKALCQFYSIEKNSRDTLLDIGEEENKFVYLIMFEEGGYMREKIMKICNSTQETVFEVNKQEARRQLQNLEAQKEDARNYILQTKRQIKQFLIEMNKMQGGNYSLLEIYKWFILKEKAIYAELNKLKFSEKILMGLLWCPTKFRVDLESRLDDIRNQRNIEGPQIHLIQDYEKYNLQRPTYIETNEFTWPFQEIVNTYGIPQYQEVNPSIFTIVTFPFLFGVMFGDIMHGTILFIFSSWLCLSPPKKGTLLFEMFKIRYLLLLMSIFSTYCGFIYNDFTSIPIELFGKSCYVTDYKILKVTQKNDCIYPVGVDPKWYLARNELAYLNSLKMKISVILGVAQMSLGVIMKAFNSMYFGRTIDFIFEFIPQITLLWCLFGFMDLMIIVKWLTDYSLYMGVKPPSVITQMIVMCLGFGNQGEGTQRETELFDNQTMIMRVLLIIAMITVPVMLFVKPIYLYNQQDHHHKQPAGSSTLIQDEDGRQRQYQAINDDAPEHHQQDNISASRQSGIDLRSIDHDQNQEKGTQPKQHGFGDLFIHQLIETIEFSLGTVSNTASYLRLWALSLAHSQLAKVFFDNTIKSGLQSKSFLALFLGFFVFLTFTISVLLMMDLMEAFLHTLRLHWVEFQNKFYKGNGLKFAPFSIENTLKTAQIQEKKIKKKK